MWISKGLDWSCFDWRQNDSLQYEKTSSAGDAPTSRTSTTKPTKTLLPYVDRTPSYLITQRVEHYFFDEIDSNRYSPALLHLRNLPTL